MSRLEDKLRALEAAFAPPPVQPARMYCVPVSLRLLDDWQGEVERARAACGEPLAPDAVPLLSSDEPEVWEQYAMQQQARLIAIGQAHMDGVAANEAKRIAAEREAKAPPTPQPKTKPTPTFVHHPNPFALART